MSALLPFSPQQLQQASGFIAEHLGIWFPAQGWPQLHGNLCDLAREAGFQEAETLMAWLITRPPPAETVDLLARHMTVGESYFFRDEAAFALFEQVILPERRRACSVNNRPLMLWSAGCSGGEEPYSLAMVVDQVWGARARAVTILASDINKQALERARRGVFSRWSLRQVSGARFNGYFSRNEDGSFQLAARICQGVRFLPVNLAGPFSSAAPFHPGSLDLIFCRNVLMYFGQDLRQRILEQFSQLLQPGGWLVVGPSESAFMQHPELVLEQVQGVFVLRKRGAAGSRISVAPPGLVPESYQPLFPFLAPSPVAPLPTAVGEVAVERILEADGAVTGERILEAVGEATGERILEEVRLAYQSGHYQQAREMLLSLLERHEEGRHSRCPVEALALAARVCANLGQLDEAKLWADRAAATDRLEAGHYFFAATVRQAGGNLAEAREWLRKTLYVDPNFILAHLTLGNLTPEKSDRIRHLNQALRILDLLDPEAPVPHSDGIPARQMSDMIRTTLEKMS
ncbi:MAG: methyltransferase domain-containing protein [Magnetococcales bacterium]|nr:methyltransferase domain-containing protein [Magnetococcales bacterium]